jgi:hypothetical protein
VYRIKGTGIRMLVLSADDKVFLNDRDMGECLLNDSMWKPSGAWLDRGARVPDCLEE